MMETNRTYNEATYHNQFDVKLTVDIEADGNGGWDVMMNYTDEDFELVENRLRNVGRFNHAQDVVDRFAEDHGIETVEVSRSAF